MVLPDPQAAVDTTFADVDALAKGGTFLADLTKEAALPSSVVIKAAAVAAKSDTLPVAPTLANVDPKLTSGTDYVSFSLTIQNTAGFVFAGTADSA